MNYDDAKIAVKSFLVDRRHDNADENGIFNVGRCLFLTGPWGIGKTHMLVADLFQDKGVLARFNPKRSIHYFSLSGKDSLESIDREIYAIFHKTRSWWNNFFNRTSVSISAQASVLLPGVTISPKVEIKHENKAKNSVSSGKSLSKKPFVFVFDDLERMTNNVPLEGVFGLIDLVSKAAGKGSRIIVVCNDEELVLKHEGVLQRSRPGQDAETAHDYDNARSMYLSYRDKISAVHVDITSAGGEALSNMFGEDAAFFMDLPNEMKTPFEKDLRSASRLADEWNVFKDNNSGMVDQESKKAIFKLIVAVFSEFEWRYATKEHEDWAKLIPDYAKQKRQGLMNELLKIDGSGNPNDKECLEAAASILSSLDQHFQKVFDFEGGAKLVLDLCKSYSAHRFANVISISGVHLPTKEEEKKLESLASITRNLERFWQISDVDMKKAFEEYEKTFTTFQLTNGSAAAYFNAFALFCITSNHRSLGKEASIDAIWKWTIDMYSEDSFGLTKAPSSDNLRYRSETSESKAFLTKLDICESLAERREIKNLILANDLRSAKEMIEMCAFKDKARENKILPDVYRNILSSLPLKKSIFTETLSPDELYSLPDWGAIFKYADDKTKEEFRRRINELADPESEVSKQRVKYIEDGMLGH